LNAYQSEIDGRGVARHRIKVVSVNYAMFEWKSGRFLRSWLNAGYVKNIERYGIGWNGKCCQICILKSIVITLLSIIIANNNEWIELFFTELRLGFHN